MYCHCYQLVALLMLRWFGKETTMINRWILFSFSLVPTSTGGQTTTWVLLHTASGGKQWRQGWPVQGGWSWNPTSCTEILVCLYTTRRAGILKDGKQWHKISLFQNCSYLQQNGHALLRQSTMQSKQWGKFFSHFRRLYYSMCGWLITLFLCRWAKMRWNPSQSINGWIFTKILPFENLSTVSYSIRKPIEY